MIKTNFRKGLLIIGLLAVAGLYVQFKTDQNGVSKEGNSPKKPINIVLMIGDGMGLAQITAARYSNNGTLNLDRFKNIGFITTHSADDFVTDSGAGATAFSTGNKTKNGYIGVDASGKKLPNLVELAHEKGVKTGIIVTSSVTHATPAAFLAHNINRDMEFEIALDIVNSPVDLLVGGGRMFFEKKSRADRQDLILELRKKGFDVDGKIKAKSASGRLAVLAADKAMPPVKTRDGRGDFLVEAWQEAINGKMLIGDKGFFVMMEGSQIDWGGHSNELGFVISETIDFDKAVGEVLNYAEAYQNTLVIVLADHETGGLALSKGSLDGKKIEPNWANKEHTAMMIPVFAYGPGADQFTGIYDNTAIFSKIKAMLPQ